jgi:small neutral amino acid transporter SnatA (MarC family)
MRRIHTGTLLAGLILTAIGLAFTAEALDVWELRLRHLRLAGPLLLVVIGVVVLLGALSEHDDRR